MNYKRRTITMILAAVLALSLLLTACKGNDTASGNDSTEGSPTITATTSDTPSPTETESATATTPELKPITTDISKYYSSDKKEFNIIQCAEDMGFDVQFAKKVLKGSYSATQEQNNKAYNYFAMEFYYDNGAIASIAYNGTTQSEESIYAFYKDEDANTFELNIFYLPANSFGFGWNGSDSQSMPAYTLTEFELSATADIKLTGREEESGNQVYVNETVLNRFVFFLEQIVDAKSASELLDKAGIEERYNDTKIQITTDLSKYFKSDNEFDIAQCAAALNYNVEDGYLVYSLSNGGKYYIHLSAPDVPDAYWNIFCKYVPSGSSRRDVTDWGMGKVIIYTDADHKNENVRVIGLSREIKLSKAEIRNVVWYLEKFAATESLDEIADIDIQTTLNNP